MFCSQGLNSQKGRFTEVNDSTCISGQTENLGLIAMGSKAVNVYLLLPKSMANL